MNHITNYQEVETTALSLAAQIYEHGALFRPVEPGMYEVTPQDETNNATLVRAEQFRFTLSLVQSMKSNA